MATLTTNEVTVTADSAYQDQYSEPVRNQFVFSYRIQVRNVSGRPVQLLARRWTVISGTGERKQVEGEGVVGQQPIIQPGQTYEYTSWVQFETAVGAMEGSYIMAREDRRGREQLFEVEVPRFVHVAPEVLN
ncbi:Co2+/Mg2+ efflux protein ApaG [Lewinella sp. 4G2]|uniref:Co2+/Mg2+ efflux protein ApaG n=1 Tax=Lewinella sp. 4G2 TaxID=1803372 RepID=UPI0007B48DF2|nr:Co2+/Mg2+ efflux protein ApaG [Lewinella sp. 4G2]OAV43784.1 Co2+/Mg2+ efflux protein ApaG [Lewinella sp. 4G2]